MSARPLEPRPHQLRQILHRQRPVVQARLVETAQVEVVALLRLLAIAVDTPLLERITLEQPWLAIDARANFCRGVRFA